MMRLGTTSLCIWLAAGILAAAGCASAPADRAAGEWRRSALRGETFTINSPGLVLGAPPTLPTPPTLRASRNAADDGPAARPWWATRNDARLGVRDYGRIGERAGYVVHIEDEQQSFPGSIHNTYRRTFETTRYGGGAR